MNKLIESLEKFVRRDRREEKWFPFVGDEEAEKILKWYYQLHHSKTADGVEGLRRDGSNWDVQEVAIIDERGRGEVGITKTFFEEWLIVDMRIYSITPISGIKVKEQSDD